MIKTEIKNLLFYKNFKSYGGAEVLFFRHYEWLKKRGEKVYVVCFEYKQINDLIIDSDDLKIIKGKTNISKIINLIIVLLKYRCRYMFCHSGPLEFGVAAILSRLNFSIFLHQPTCMSFNELNKFSIFFWHRYCNFVKKDKMFFQIKKIKSNLNLLEIIYIEIRTFILQLIYKYADSIFVLSKFAVKEKMKIFGLRAIALKGAVTKESVLNLVNKSNKIISNDLIELVSISRLDINKRIEVIIKAVHLLIKKGFNIRLRIGGKGPAEIYLKKLVSKLKLENNIEFLGFVKNKDLENIYKTMDLFTTIDWADYRITTYEVLAENRRVIVSDDTDLDTEILDSGYLFKSNPDPNSLSNTIEFALKNNPKWSKNKLSKYLEKYSWDNYFTNIYSFLLN